MSELETIQDYYATTLSKDGHITPMQHRILAAALALFSEKGYEDVSTKEIAARAGVAEGSLFHHFGNKKGLLTAVMQPIVQHILPTMLNTLTQTTLNQATPTLESFVVPLVRDRVAFIDRNRTSLAVILSQFFNSTEDRSSILGMIAPATLAQTNQAMESLKAAHELINWPNRMILQLIFSTIGGCLIDRVLAPDTDQLDQPQVVAYLSDFLINGLRPRRAKLTRGV